MKKSKEVSAPIEVITVGTTYGNFKTNTMVKKYANRKKWTPKNPLEVFSFIPGTITGMFVKEGETVEVGTPIYSFKAMKMENKVESAIAGTIKKIHYNIGESFPKGVIIVEYEG